MEDAGPVARDQLVRRQFGPRAEAYVHSLVHAAGQDLDWLEQAAECAKPRHALDLGTGGGHVAYRIARHAGRVVACDLSEQMIKAVLAIAAERGCTNIEGRIAAAEQLPFDTGSFDFVASRFSAHHWQDFEAGLREARRVLAPGGKAMFIDVTAPEEPSADTHLQAVELLRDPSHVRDYRIGQWIAALGRAGFRVGAIRTLRLRMEFASWIARIATPPSHADAIRSLQRVASADVVRRLGIEPDGSFQLDCATMEAD